MKAGVQHVFKVRAVNSFGNRDATPAIFTWSILTPAQGIKNLIALFKSIPLNHGIQNALITQLNGVLQFLDHKPMMKVGACAELNGFIQQIQGIARTDQITLSNALQLMNAAQAIQTALNC